jgi:hypothetical protein
VELRQLEHFVVTAEERHFTRAARRLHIVQSGLSASIRALERELGAPLFVRSTRRVELTEAGRALLGEARRTLAAAQAARDAVADVQGLLRGRLAVGTMQILPPAVDLLGTLGRFHAQHPDVELRLRQSGRGPCCASSGRPASTWRSSIRPGGRRLASGSAPWPATRCCWPARGRRRWPNATRSGWTSSPVSGSSSSSPTGACAC